MTTYATFIDTKDRQPADAGFKPTWEPDFLYPFQRHLVEWALQRGRAAIFADCGLGKTPMQLVWAENVRRETSGRVLILTPLAVSAQTQTEAEKFGIVATRSRRGEIGESGIYITNYEQLHHFNPADFSGIVCDESSILKSFRGATQTAVTAFMKRIPYRLLCTATAAPNDYVELGTSSEALGELGQVEMLSRYFKQDQKVHALNERGRRKKDAAKGIRSVHRQTVAGTGGSWRLKSHAVETFWRWVCSWARACRHPSDLGFSNDGFDLPPLVENHHTVSARTLPDGMLFPRPAFGLQEEREERRRTVKERCETVAKLVDHDRPALVWCHLNAEGDTLAKMIPGSVQVKGPMSDDEKESAYAGFSSGSIRVLISKPRLGAWGLNWQHCNHVVTFASHSWEGYYQSVRRCWRFGQTLPVTVDIVSAEGEQYVRENMQRKAESAGVMFSQLVAYMHRASEHQRSTYQQLATEVNTWIANAK